MKNIFLTLFVIGLVFPISAIAQSGKVLNSSGDKPKWIKNTASLIEKRSNDSYTFEVISIPGENLQDIVKLRMNELAERIGKSHQIETTSQVDIQNLHDGSETSSKIVFNSTSTNNSTTEVFYAKMIDDYWEYISSSTGNTYIYYALYAVSKMNENPKFDDFSTTTSYGVTPAVMSIVPGLGQFYKGSTVKGICMLGGVAACGLGALFCENERADYKNKMKEQPKFAKTYNTKANNYETARNICLGAAAAIWVYNIVDAATAKGARKVVIKPAHGSYLSVHPVATPNAMGLSLSYNF